MKPDDEYIDAKYFDAGCAKSTETGRWHAVLRAPNGEMIMSNRSFASKEEVIGYLKSWTDEQGAVWESIH